MVHLRATRKLLSRLPAAPSGAGTADNALGDWFVNRFVVDRQPLLILVSAFSLLPILLPAQRVRSLPERLATIVEHRLERLGVDGRLIASEIETMGEVVVCGTNDRSVVGTMVDFIRTVPYYLPEAIKWGEAELLGAEAKLGMTPCHSKGRDVVFPDRETPALLKAKWSDIV